MCGITGIYNYSDQAAVAPDLLKNMCRMIAHRCPDGECTYYDQAAGLGLGHRRLSIIDLEGGHQPMTTADECLWIVFNGEIYNFPELKAELEAKGHRFQTRSDTEVILYLYREYGIKGFARLNGIFAFAIYDTIARSLVLARDHFGVKPLYYSLADNRLRFGSEIKTILCDPDFSREISLSSLQSYLTFRYNPSPQTMLQDVMKLPPAHYLRIQPGKEVEIDTFWDYRPQQDDAITEQEAITEYQRLLEQAVRRQMISDVPVGLFLSGGVDSAVIGKLMSEASDRPIKTFTIGFEGNGDFNELDDARKTAALIGSDHRDAIISQQEYLDFFMDSFYYTEEPIAQTTIPALYYVSRMAAESLKVVQGGQGADEPLAGYARYIGGKYISEYGKYFKWIPLQTIASTFRRNEKLQRAAYASTFQTDIGRFLGIYSIFTEHQQNQLLLPDCLSVIDRKDREIVERLFEQTGGLSDKLNKLLYMDTRKTLSDNLLIFNDKMTMANALEMRVPFLDVELIKFIETLPSDLKLRGKTGKYLHKKAVQKWIPEEISYRKKRNFRTPMDEWLQSDLSEVTKSMLNSADSACRSYFDLSYINTIIDAHAKGKADYQKHIFALLSFEVWHKNFLKSTDFKSTTVTANVI